MLLMGEFCSTAEGVKCLPVSSTLFAIGVPTSLSLSIEKCSSLLHSVLLRSTDVAKWTLFVLVGWRNID